MNLLKLFQLDQEPKADFGNLFERISELGDGLSDNELKEVTGSAGLLGRVAYADTHITPDERQKITSILQTGSKLSTESVEIILTLITEQKVELLTLEEHFYTRLINEVMTREQKHALLENMFQIAAADGTICLQEENLIYNTATSLKISRKELVELKRQFKAYLSVFK